MKDEVIETVPQGNEVVQRMKVLQEHATLLATAVEDSDSITDIMQAANQLMEKAPDALTGGGKAIAMSESVTEEVMTKNDTQVMQALNDLRRTKDEKGERPNLSEYQNDLPEYMVTRIVQLADMK